MSTRGCDVHDCDDEHYAKGLCRRHYQRSRRGLPLQGSSLQARPDTHRVVVVLPDDLIPIVTQLVENDARPLFRHLWRAIGEWHLAGLLEEERAS